jgi:hypothetical protein
MSANTIAPRLSTHLTDFPTVAEPDVCGALAIFPLIGPVPTLEYLSFAQAREIGARVTELDSGASVRDLAIENPAKRGFVGLCEPKAYRTKDERDPDGPNAPPG